MSILKQKNGRNSGVLGITCENEKNKVLRARGIFHLFVVLVKTVSVREWKNIYIVINLSNHRFDNSNQIICCRFFCPSLVLFLSLSFRHHNYQIQVVVIATQKCRDDFFKKSRFHHRCFFKQSVSKTQLKTAAGAFVYKMTDVNTKVNEPPARVNKTKTKLWNFYLGISTLSR